MEGDKLIVEDNRNRQDNWPDVVSLAQRGRRASVSLPSGLNKLLQFAEFTWQNKPEDAEKDYFDEVAEAEAEKQTRYANTEASYNPAGIPKRKHSRYALGEGVYDPIRSDSEPEDVSVDELSEIDSPSPSVPSQHFFNSNSNGQPRKDRKVVTVDVADDTGEEDNIGSATTKKRKPLAARRKRGISPINIANSNYKKSDPQNHRGVSPTPSTSSSIREMIRDKLTHVSRSIPTVFMKRKADEYKLQAFVAILFLTIMLLVGSIYVIHQEKELQKAYFNKIRFSGKDRKIRVSNLRNREVLAGVLGTNLSKKDKPWPCLEKDNIEGQSCLEWMNRGRLYFSHEQPKESAPTIECYGILWQSLSPDFIPKDCFHVSEKKGFHFYGGGEMSDNQWPLNSTFVPMSPFITGRDQLSTSSFRWGRTIRPYFLNAPGASIHVANDVPLYISINDEQNPGMMCLAAKRDEFAYPTVKVPVKLNYTICTGENIRDVITQMSEKGNSDGLLQEQIHLAYALAKSPIWRILPTTINQGDHSEVSLLNHTDVIAALHLSEGIILLDETWQKRLGDLEMDPDRFPGITETFNITRRRGFKVALTIQPFFSTESDNYLTGIEKNLWIRERSSTKAVAVPALTRYKSAATAVVLDITRKESRDWIEEKISHVVHKYGIDALFLDLTTARHFPEFYQFNAPLRSPDHYKEIFVDVIRHIGGVNTIGVSGSIKAPKIPSFVSLRPVESSWEGLQSIIPNFLTMGVSGFSFIMPGAVGGDFLIPNSQDFESNKPERNLYIRWLELVHFLPVIQYTYLPSDYDQSVVDIARSLNLVRNNKVFRYMKKAIDEALRKGLPIIQPLWMIDPNEPACLKRWDEFTIGGDILVAPILTYNTTERSIYLPKGRWRDELDGTTTKGDKWLNNYKVKENQIAFFTKIADG